MLAFPLHRRLLCSMGSRLAFGCAAKWPHHQSHGFPANAARFTPMTPTRSLLTMSDRRAVPHGTPQVCTLDCTGTIMRVKGALPRCRQYIVSPPRPAWTNYQQPSSEKDISIRVLYPWPMIEIWALLPACLTYESTSAYCCCTGTRSHHVVVSNCS